MTITHDRRIAQYVCLRLPPPISTNALYRAYARGGRVSTIKSKEYRAWVAVAGAELELQRPACVPGAYGLRIALPRKCRLDLDNASKATIDLLVTHNVVEGDGPRHMQKLEVYRGTDDAMMVWVISTKEAANESAG